MSTDPYAHLRQQPPAQPPAYGAPPQYPAQYSPYPPQPYYYAPPAYPPPGYYPGQYYPYPYPSPGNTAGIAAAIFWILLIVRDIMVGFFGFLTGGFWPFFGWAGPGMEWVFILPFVSAAAAGYIAWADLKRTNFEVSTVAGIVAVVCGTFPGIIVLGPFGAGFGITAICLHAAARKGFKPNDPYGRNY